VKTNDSNSELRKVPRNNSVNQSPRTANSVADECY
jgi:hypothetical protein